jgi:hypothetical protein
LGIKAGAIVAEKPRRHIFWDARSDGNDDVREDRPRVIEVVLGRPSRVIGMRMIEAKQVGPQLPGSPLGLHVVLRADEEPSARPLICRVRESEGGNDVPVAAEERTAALIRVRLDTVLTDGVRHPCLKVERHQRASFGVRPR